MKKLSAILVVFSIFLFTQSLSACDKAPPGKASTEQVYASSTAVQCLDVVVINLSIGYDMVICDVMATTPVPVTRITPVSFTMTKNYTSNLSNGHDRPYKYPGWCDAKKIGPRVSYSMAC